MGCNVCEGSEMRRLPGGETNNPVTTKEFICSKCAMGGRGNKKKAKATPTSQTAPKPTPKKVSTKAKKKAWTDKERATLKKLMKAHGPKEATQIHAKKTGRSEHSVGYQVYKMNKGNS